MVSQRERLEDIQNYAETLEELKFNSKPHISTLTELARDYGKNRQGREVIEIIKKRIVSKETPITQKMPTLYLLDSILKNHPDNYKQHIEEILASVFEVTFSSGDEKIRMAMYKLRQTWTPWFQYKTLYDLDMRTKKLDKAWPIIENPSKSGSGSSDLPTASKPKPPSDIKRQTSNIHVNPNFVSRAPSVSEDSQNEGNEDDELKAMEEKIKEMQEKQKRKKAQIEKDRKRKELAAILDKEAKELERVERELKETELPKISTSGSKTKDSSHNSSSTSSSSSSSKASTSKVCIMVKAC